MTGPHSQSAVTSATHCSGIETSCGNTQLSSDLTKGCTEGYINKLLEAGLTQWLRCCATNRKVVGSIPDGVIEIFF